MRQGRPLTLTELARELDAPISSTFSLAKALRNRGYLYSVGTRRALYPTRKMFDVMGVVTKRDPVLEMFGPVLTQLRDATRETVVLGKQHDSQIVYLAVVEGPRTIRFTAQVGAQARLHTSAIGKAILGSFDEKVLRETIAGLSLERMTRASLVNPVKLFDNVRDGVRRGYQVTVGENVDDVMGIAACVLVGDEPFGIAIAGPVERMSRMRARHARALLTACRCISEHQARVLDGD